MIGEFAPFQMNYGCLRFRNYEELTIRTAIEATAMDDSGPAGSGSQPAGQPAGQAAGQAAGPERVPADLRQHELRVALRRARIEEAERSGAIYDLRGAELARLEILDEALAPIYASLPPGVDFFDHGIIASERPRLFIDIVASVEMARDSRTYRLLLDTLEGRVALAESTDVKVMERAVTNHIARRLLAREKALASSAYPPGMLVRDETVMQANILSQALREPRRGAIDGGDQPAQRQRGSAWRGLLIFLLGIILGAILLFVWLEARSRY